VTELEQLHILTQGWAMPFMIFPQHLFYFAFRRICSRFILS
jgi:hypothetical protein